MQSDLEARSAGMGMPSRTARSARERGRGPLAAFAELAVFLGLAFAAAAFGAQFEPGDWYAGLRKPALTPPGWVFPPVWAALYVCIGVAGALVWRRTRARLPMALWGAQLALNAAWSWLFFGLQRPDLAFLEIRVLWIAIALTLFVFSRVHGLAAALLAPYLGWVAFAAWLNWEIWRLNA